MLTAVDLFCGSGGFSAGMIDAGVEVVSAYDNWPAAVSSYRRNIADHMTEFDVADVKFCGSGNFGARSRYYRRRSSVPGFLDRRKAKGG